MLINGGLGVPAVSAGRHALGVECACESDVCELGDVTVAAEQYVGRLQVQVDNAVGVEEVHPLARTQRDVSAPATKSSSDWEDPRSQLRMQLMNDD